MARRFFLLAAVAALVAALPSAGRTTTVPATETKDRLSVGGVELHLNGDATRTLLGIDAYHCALYLPRRDSRLQSILDPALPKAMSFRVLTSPIGGALPSDLRRKLAAALPPTALQRVVEAYDGLRSGDEVVIAYLPKAGTEVLVNGLLRNTVDGPSMMSVFLNHWLGDAPVSENLRNALLGNPGAAPYRPPSPGGGRL